MKPNFRHKKDFVTSIHRAECLACNNGQMHLCLNRREPMNKIVNCAAGCAGAIAPDTIGLGLVIGLCSKIITFYTNKTKY